MRYTKEEKLEITIRLRAVAVAIAEFWDTLREIEARTGKEIEVAGELFSNLAGDCNIPPETSDLESKAVRSSITRRYAHDLD